MADNSGMIVPEDERGLSKIPIEQSYGGLTKINIQKQDVFAGASEKRATDKETAILCAEIDKKDVRILPDTASPYLPWSWYADRLTRAFGPMGWSLLPVTDEQNNPRPAVAKDNVLYREYILRIQGRFVSSAIGECAYSPNNRRMTYGDAVEGARSNALSRCCKSLGMASDLYSDGWREEWTKENTVCVYALNGRNERVQLWRRKTALPLKGEQGHANPPCPCEDCVKGVTSTAKDGKPQFQPPTVNQDAPVTKEDVKALKGLMEEYCLSPEDFGAVIESEIGRKPSGAVDLKKSEFQKVMKAFAEVREKALSISGGKIQRPPV